jgi:regulator of sigma E protease
MIELLLAAELSPPLAYLVGGLGFIVAFGLAVFVHELGHFLAAKAFGVRVERFVIGFDKAVFGFMPKCIWEKQIGETTYGLALVPLGGYVKMVGTVHPDIEAVFEGKPKEERTESLAEQAIADQGALYGKPFYQKFIIYAAGVTMNMLLAICLVVFLSVKGTMQDRPLPSVVGWIDPSGIVAKSGLQMGDTVTRVNGKMVATEEAFFGALFPAETKAGDKVTGTLTLQRGDQEVTKDIAILVPGDDAKKDSAELTEFSQFMSMISRPAHVAMVSPNGPADKAGMRDGDTITAIDGEPIADWWQLVSIIRARPEQEMAATVDRGGKSLDFKLKVWESADEEGVGQAGIVYGNPDKELHSESLSEAVQTAPLVVALNTQRYLENLKKLGAKLARLNGKAIHRELSGPVGIAQVTSRAAQRGFNDWVQIMVMLNIALAVMNSLPIPVLDGGHIVFAAYEAIFRRPLPALIFVRVMEGAVMVFLVFFLLITFSDVWKLI